MRRLGCVAVAALVGSVVGALAQAVPIRLGHGPAAEEQLWLMKAKPDLTPGQGKDYTMDFQLFRGTDQRFKAVEAGQLDVFTGSAASTILAWSQGFDFKAMASISRESNKGFVVQYMVLQDSPVKTVPDLKDKTVGNNAARSSIELWARLALAKHGLNPDRDVSWAIVPFPSQGEAVRSGKIDVGAFPQPFAAAEIGKGGLRTLFTSREGNPSDEEVQLVLVAKEFAAKHQAALRSFLADFVAATKFYLEKPREARLALLDSQLVRLPRDLFLGMQDHYRDPSGRISMEAMKAAQDAMLKIGYQKQPVDIEKFVDLSLLPR
jgi:ABC-type nitrate/sulfonate/bicarbonate transport system substrate-binding protein